MMSKIREEEMLDYLEGRLDASRQAVVEAHLENNAEDAQLIEDMKLASVVLRDWDATLPTQASENFWPQLREQLPSQPGRPVLRQLSMKGWALPSLRFSLGAAVAAAVIAMIAFMSAPQQSIAPTTASDLTPADEAFVTQSLQRHEAYSSSQPLSGALSVPAIPGDRRSIDSGDYESEEYIP